MTKPVEIFQAPHERRIFLHESRKVFAGAVGSLPRRYGIPFT